HRPAEVILYDHAEAPVGEWATTTARLTEQAIAVTVRPPRGRTGAPGESPGQSSGETPWVAPWPAEGEVPSTYLADLVCAAECSAAAAIGRAVARGVADYAFGAEIEPALVRRGLHAAGAAAGGWAVGGARLLTLDPRS